jgi:hypothetical protein
MATSTPLYSGVNAGAGQINPIGDKTLQAQERMQETILEANKFKYTERKKEEAEFLKGIQVTPEVLLSAKMREQQATKIQEFNKIYSPLIKKGYLTMEEKTRMATDRAILEGWQKDQLGKLGMWKQMNDAVTANPLELDSVEMQEITRKLFEEGELTVTRPPVRAKNVASYLKQYSSKITDEFPSDPILKTENGTTFRRTQTSNIKADQISQKIEEALLSGNEGVLKGLVEDFDRWNPTEESKVKWLMDIDQSGDIDAEERQNGILKWAKQHPPYQQMAVVKSSDWMPVSKPSGTGTSDTIKPTTLGGVPTKMPSGRQDSSLPKQFGATEYDKDGKMIRTDKRYSDKSFHFTGGNTSAINGIPTRGGTVLNEDWSDAEIASGVVDATIRLYDPVQKVFLIQIVRTSESAGQKSSTLIEVPEANIMDYSKIPLQSDIPEIKTIGDYEKYWGSSATPREKITKPDKGKLY